MTEPVFTPVRPVIVPLNIAVRDRSTGEPRPIGKLVQFRGRWIVHAHARPNVMNYNTDALAVGWPMLVALLRAGGEDVFLYVAREGATFHTTTERIRAYGVVGLPDDCGHKFNLPMDKWECTPGKLPLEFIPDATYEIFAADVPPWPAPAARKRDQKPRQEIMPLWPNRSAI